MKKELLKLQLEESNKVIRELKMKAESDNWKLQLWQEISDPDLELIGFTVENTLTNFLNDLGITERYDSGQSTVTLSLHKKPKK